MASLSGHDEDGSAERAPCFKRLKYLGTLSTLTGEQKLCLAILADAILCFTRSAQARRWSAKQAVLEAEAWIMESDRDWTFSFENVCGAVGLDSNRIRQELRRSVPGSGDTS